MCSSAPLLNPPEMSHGHETGALQTWTCVVRGRKATFSVGEDGGCRLIYISSDEVIGGLLVSQHSVQVWFMPLVGSTGASKRIRILRKSPIMRFPDPNIASQARDLVQEAAFKTAPHNRRALAIINPKSGRGRAPHMYQNVIKPVLQCACINVREFITESPGHATEFMQNTSSSDDIDLIITVGGDGTTNEVLQGMLSREDWERFCTIPILQVPCGTGNALAASSCNWDVLTAVHTAIKGQVRPLDVASFVQVALPRRFSFLSVTYGLISSLDVGTEHLRWIGDARFTLGAVYQIMRQKKYRVRAAYVEHVEGRAQMTQREDVIQGNQSQQAKEEKEEKKIEGGGKPSQSAAGIIDSTDQHVYQEDQDADLRNPLSKDLFLDRYGTEKVAGKPMPKSSGRALSSVHNGLSTDLDMGPGPSMEYLDDFKVLCRGDIDEMDAECALNPHGGARKSTSSEIANIAGNSGRSADDDAIGSERSQWQRNLPSCWHVLPADHVQLFAACNLPRLDMNFHFSPESDLSNGHWNLIYTTGKAGRIRGLQLLSASETGKHLDDPFVMHQKIKALFLHPLAHEGSTWLQLDGEVVPHQRPMLVEVHRGLCRVLVPPRVDPRGGSEGYRTI